MRAGGHHRLPGRRRRVVHWVIAVVVLLVILVAADRVSAAVAAKAAQRYLAQQTVFEQAPSVSISGFPFLTQAIEGRYGTVEVKGSQVALDGVVASNLHAELHGVHLPLSAVFGGAVHSLPVDSITGSLTFTYAEVASLTQIDGLVLREEDGQLHATATVSIPELNVTTTVSGVAAVAVVSGNLRLSVTQLAATGLAVPSSVLSALAATLAVPIPIPELPYGLQITSVTPGSSGMQVDAAAAHVVISPSGGG
jgi:hypothetical protein